MLHYFFLVSRCIRAALRYKKAYEVLKLDGLDREGIRNLTGEEKR